MLVEQVCARKDCDEIFVKARHNMKYCSNKCCRLAANAKILEDYHDRKAWQKAANRRCKKCDAKLSRYNINKVCNACELKVSSELDKNIEKLGEILSAS